LDLNQALAFFFSLFSKILSQEYYGDGTFCSDLAIQVASSFHYGVELEHSGD